jgi:hypothetical protein
MTPLYEDVRGIVVSTSLTSAVNRVVLGMFDSRGSVVIEISWHCTYIYGLVHMFKVSSSALTRCNVSEGLHIQRRIRLSGKHWM